SAGGASAAAVSSVEFPARPALTTGAAGADLGDSAGTQGAPHRSLVPATDLSASPAAGGPAAGGPAAGGPAASGPAAGGPAAGGPAAGGPAVGGPLDPPPPHGAALLSGDPSDEPSDEREELDDDGQEPALPANRTRGDCISPRGDAWRGSVTDLLRGNFPEPATPPPRT